MFCDVELCVICWFCVHVSEKGLVGWLVAMVMFCLYFVGLLAFLFLYHMVPTTYCIFPGHNHLFRLGVGFEI